MQHNLVKKFMKKKRILSIFLCLSLLYPFGAIANSDIHIKPFKHDHNVFQTVSDEFVLDQYQNQTEANGTIPFGVLSPVEIKLAQSFKPSNPILCKIELLINRNQVISPITVSIKESLESSNTLMTYTINYVDISDYPVWTIVDFSDINVTAESTYYIVCSTTGLLALDSGYQWHMSQHNDNPVDNYKRGVAYVYDTGDWGSHDEFDFCFRTYGLGEINIPPIPQFNWNPLEPKNGEIITFNASESYDPDGEIILYQWDWNNDGIFDESKSVPITSYSWTDSGPHPVTLQVLDNMESSCNTTKNINTFDYIVPDDFPTIQDAVNNSETEYQIYVRPGTYKENIYIDIERITLQGSDKFSTTIDGQNRGHVINISENSHYLEISGFTIKNSDTKSAGINIQSSFNNIHNNNIIENGYGVDIRHSSANEITTNYFQNNGDGITIHSESFDVLISNNTIQQNQQNGILIDYLCDGHTIQHNTITNHICGIKINGVSKTTVVRENIIRNNNIGIDCLFFSDGNRFFYNTLAENNVNAHDTCYNRWDNDVRGNYWDDYEGVDANGDGIGDTPYSIGGGQNKDRYPLMHSWGPPTTPVSPIGQIKGKPGETYEYSTRSIDPDGDSIKYGWDWNGDGSVDEWTFYYSSGEMASVFHKFTKGEYQVQVIAKDTNNQSSAWSNFIKITISRSLIDDTLLDSLRSMRSQHLFLTHRIESVLDRVFECTFEKPSIPEKKQLFLSYTDYRTIYVPDDYPTIQDAINNSNDYDTIIVKPGIYHEHLIVDKKIKIIGEDTKLTIIDGDNAVQHIIELISNNVTIQNFTLQNCNNSNSGVRIKTNDNTISKNIILNCGGGVEMFWTQRNTITSNKFFNNTYGIRFSDSINCIAIDNIIEDNLYGIEVGFTTQDEEKTNIRLDKNYLYKNKEYGILLIRAYTMYIESNTIIENLVGSETLDGKNIQFFDNKYFKNTQGVVMYRSQNNTFSSNKITDKLFTLSYTSTILLSSPMGVLILIHSNDNHFYNNIFENQINAYDYLCNNTYDNEIKGNYWNDYTGKDADGDGIGDTPYFIAGADNVDRYPLMQPWE